MRSPSLEELEERRLLVQLDDLDRLSLPWFEMVWKMLKHNRGLKIRFVIVNIWFVIWRSCFFRWNYGTSIIMRSRTMQSLWISCTRAVPFVLKLCIDGWGKWVEEGGIITR
jgi:hypothetical protein